VSLFGHSNVGLHVSLKPYSKWISENELTYLNRGQLLLGICRAKPETEVATDEFDLKSTMQPIIRDNKFLVHNGAINTYFEECYKQQTTKIDSECILIQYERYGYPKFVNKLIGGFAFLLYDGSINQLIIGVNHMPLYHMYIKGIGYFVSSVKDALKEVLKYYHRIEYDTINVWEAWYHTEVSSFTVRMIDLDSGMVKMTNFKPLYLINDKLVNKEE